MYGYHGRVLVVDLTARAVRWDPLDEDVLRSFIGGVGLGAYLLFNYCPPGVEPLDAANPLIFVGSRSSAADSPPPASSPSSPSPP